MKTSAIVCSVLAGTLGFSSIASAQDWRGRNDRDQRWEQRRDRAERQERREDRREARQDRRQHWQQQRQQEAWRHQARPGQVYVNPAPAYRYAQPAYRYAQPAYTSRYHRGGYLPREYRHSGYYVNNWQAYPGLYAPPSGYQWMNVGGSDFLLVALATGLIANLLVNP